MFDLAIIGGGVAGMTAAIYAARAGMSTVIIEQGGFGGQAALTAKIENYPSYKEVEGFQLAADMKAQVDALGVESSYAQVKALSKDGDVFTVSTDSSEIQARTVIIANGVCRRELGIEGEDTFRGRGVSWCAVCDGGFFRKKKTAVIGAGNSALGDAIYLSNLCEEVYLIFRREKPTATKSYLDQLESIDNIRLMPRQNLQRFIHLDSLAAKCLEGIILDLSVHVDQHQPAVHGYRALLQKLVQFFHRHRLKERSCRSRQLLSQQAVLPGPLFKQIITDLPGQRCRGNKKRQAHNDKKGQQDLPPDAGPECLFSPDP